MPPCEVINIVPLIERASENDQLREQIAELETEAAALREENEALRDMIRSARGALDWTEPHGD